MVPSSCHSRTTPSSIRIDVRVVPAPVHTGSADVQIRLVDRTHKASRPKVSVEADMSHPGMTPLFASASPMGADQYEAKLNFNMPGDWTVSVRAHWPDGAEVEKQVALTVREK